MLGELVRIIDGRTIERYAEDEIYAPLGMVDSYIALPPDRLDATRAGFEIGAGGVTRARRCGAAAPSGIRAR